MRQVFYSFYQATLSISAALVVLCPCVVLKQLKKSSNFFLGLVLVDPSNSSFPTLRTAAKFHPGTVVFNMGELRKIHNLLPIFHCIWTFQQFSIWTLDIAHASMLLQCTIIGSVLHASALYREVSVEQ